MDSNGYPDDKELKIIEKWDYLDFEGLMEYVKDLWRYEDRFCKGRIYYRLSTGGWSGNEDIIGALRYNIMFWTMCWWSSERGGHYVFKIPKIVKE